MEKIKEGDFIRIEYTGKKKSDNRVFDTTDEALARKENIYDQKTRYGPSLVVVGKTPLLHGLAEAIQTMRIGETKTLDFPPEKAFGKRSPRLLSVLSESEFRKNNINPYPGLVVDLDGRQAIIKSVTSGRVMVDLNHPLAGEDVIYDLRIVDMIDGVENKVRAFLDSNGMSEADVKVKEGEVEIGFPSTVEKDAVSFITRTGFAEVLKQLVPEVKSVKILGEKPEGEKKPDKNAENKT